MPSGGGRAEIACLARIFHGATVGIEAMRRAALAAVAQFDAETHPRVTATAHTVLGLTLEISGRSGLAVPELLHGIQMAREAGMRKLISQGVQVYGICLWDGPTPAQTGIQRLDELLAGDDITLRDRLSILPALAALHAMRCHADVTRRLTAEAEQIQERLGTRENFAEDGVANWLGPALALIGETDAAVNLLRGACASHRRRGENGTLSQLAPTLGIVLVDAGRDLAEADALCDEGRRLTQPDDTTSEIMWRILRAKLLRRAGNTEQALPLTEEAIAYAEKTDWLNLHADALGLAASLHAQAGAPAKAKELRARALALYRQKGNLAGERRLLSQTHPGASR